MEYPTNIVNSDGEWARIHRGWDLNPVMLELDYAKELGDNTDLIVEETGLAYIPRIKWCDKWGNMNMCANIGEWHSEWIALWVVDNSVPQKNRYTIVKRRK